MVAIEKMRASQVARDLGVSTSAISKWVLDFKKHGNGAFPGKGLLAPQDDELRKLQKENRRLTMERDLLKKTIVFFAEHDRKGMTS